MAAAVSVRPPTATGSITGSVPSSSAAAGGKPAAAASGDVLSPLLNGGGGDDGYAYEAVPEFGDDDAAGRAADDDDLAAVVNAMLKTDPGLLAGTLSMGGVGGGDAATSGRGGGVAAAPAGPPRAHTDTLPSVADDFIRNFLIRAGMGRTLDAFNTEWFELQSRGALPADDALGVPDVYAQNAALSDLVARLRAELGHAQEVAAKAQGRGTGSARSGTSTACTTSAWSRRRTG
jgi:hypothetical protein